VNDFLTFLGNYERPINHGLYYGLAAIGLSLTVRYLKTPDFTTLGSIVLGGVVGTFIFLELASHPIIASIVGCVGGFSVGVLLGIVTHFLKHMVRIPLAYAGILTYFASMSAAYFIAPDGYLELDRRTKTIFTYMTGPESMIVAMAIIVTASWLLHREFKRKNGKLIIAMTSSEAFLKLRHPCPAKTTRLILTICNGLVGLCGALFAIRDSDAPIKGGNEMTFLLVSLGSIYVFEFISSLFLKISDASLDTSENPISILNKPAVNHLIRLVCGKFSSKNDESKGIFVAACGYATCCVLLQLLFTGVSFIAWLPAHFEYAATVAVIVIVLSCGTRFRSKC
jgi:ABC-type uncharacterized transport system permease subunit